ncbi:MAG: DUF2793 domain-containing protein, partial [Nitratireductor sp.]
MQDTPNLTLPYILPSQAQKHVTHNEAIRRLDAVVQISALSRSISQPPLEPEEGVRYIVGENAQGEWQGHEEKLAIFQDAVWQFLVPKVGWLVWVQDDEELLVNTDTGWLVVNGGSGSSADILQNLQLLGVNSTADETNKLSVASDATLLSNAGSDHRLKINKLAATDTASLIFSSNYAGNAEIGLAGNSDLSFKVSPDGVQWNNAFNVSSQTGQVHFSQNDFAENARINLLGDDGRFAGSPAPKSVSISNFVEPSYLSSYNGSVFTSSMKFVQNNSTYGGSNGALSADVNALVSKYWDSNNRRYGAEFNIMTVDCGAGSAGASTFSGVTRYTALTNTSSAIWCGSTLGVKVQCKSGSLYIRLNNGWRLYVDGVEALDGVVLAPADGWKHIDLVS